MRSTTAYPFASLLRTARLFPPRYHSSVWHDSSSSLSHISPTTISTPLLQKRRRHSTRPQGTTSDSSTDTLEAGGGKRHRPSLLIETLNGRQRNYFPTADDAPAGKLTWEWAKEAGGPVTALDRVGKVLPPGVVSWLRAMFLPVGYPQVRVNTVSDTHIHPHTSPLLLARALSPDQLVVLPLVYAKVHLFQFMETFLWSGVSVLCSQAMLSSIGVGGDSAAAAAGGAVAIRWILKDGLGELGKLFFIQRFARSFDSHPKTWKLVGELSSLSGAFLQLCTVIAPSSWFLGLASVGYAARSVHFSIWGATHMTFTRNFALQGNVGDLVAKDDSQMSVAHLFGMLGGVGLLTLSHTPLFLFGTFFLLIPIHFHMTLALLRAANFEVLNLTNITILSSMFVRTGSVPSMVELAPHVKGFGEWVKDPTAFPRIDIAAEATGLEDVEGVMSVLKDENYLLSLPRRKGSTIRAPLHTAASPHDVIKATLHAAHFHHSLFNSPAEAAAAAGGDNARALALLKESHEWTVAKFPQFIAEVDSKDWQSDAVFWGDSGRRLTWDRGEKEV